MSQLSKGERLFEMLKQNQYVPMVIEEQILQIFAATQTISANTQDTWISKYSKNNISKYMDELLKYMKNEHSDVIKILQEKSNEKIDEKLNNMISEALKKFDNIFQG